MDNKTLKKINEGVIKENIPDFILDEIDRNKTPLSKNGAFPVIDGCDFLQTLYEKEFENIKTELKEIGKIDFIESTSVNNALSEIILQCQKEEEPIKNELEKICADYVIKLFNVPDESVELEITLKNDIEINGEIVQFDKTHDSSQYDSVDDVINFDKEIGKRKIISSMNIGYGLMTSFDDKIYDENILKLNKKLPKLYKAFNILMRYSLFTNSLENMSEKHNLQIGTVELIMHQIDEMPVIKSQGLIFPVLLCETIRGFMELFSTHGLPQNKKDAIKILSKTDYLKAEPWYMRAGYPICNIILKNKINSKIIPYLYSRICRLNVNDFNVLMQNMLLKTKKGDRLFNLLKQHSENDMSNVKIKTMDEPDTDSFVITDNCIREEEL